MKPVNLYPIDRPTGESSGPNMGLIGGAIGVFVIVVVVAVLTGMSRVDTLRSETGKLESDARTASEQEKSVRAQKDSIGVPVYDSDTQLAETAEKTLVATYTERVDFKSAVQELQSIMPKGGWYTEVRATSSGSLEGASGGTGDSGVVSVSISGIVPNKKLLAGFNERVNSTQSFEEATAVEVKTVKLRGNVNRRIGTYYSFKITANLVDTLPPFKDQGAGGSSGSTLVSGGEGQQQVKLSLDSDPTDRAAARRAKEAAINPFERAAGVVSKGAGS